MFVWSNAFLGGGSNPLGAHFRFFSETALVAVDDKGDIKVLDGGFAPCETPRVVDHRVDGHRVRAVGVLTSDQLELVDRKVSDHASTTLESGFASPADNESVGRTVGIEPNDFEPAVGAVSDVRQLLGEISQRVFVVFGNATNLGRKAPNGTRLPMSLPVRHYYS